jgi:hypothetical protein
MATAPLLLWLGRGWVLTHPAAAAVLRAATNHPPAPYPAINQNVAVPQNTPDRCNRIKRNQGLALLAEIENAINSPSW